MENKFSMIRMQCVMTQAELTWDDIEQEFKGARVKLKAPNPPQELVDNICKYMGLENSDYVMMKSSQTNFISYKFVTEDRIPVAFLNIDAINILFKASEWSWSSIASLMTGKSVFLFGTNYITCSSIKTISSDDIRNLCYALNCKINDIIKIKIRDMYVPERVLNDRQKYILNKNVFLTLSDDDFSKLINLLKVSNLFLKEEENVSYEFLTMLQKSLSNVTGKEFPLHSLVLNYEELDNVPVTRRRRTKAPVTVPNPAPASEPVPVPAPESEPAPVPAPASEPVQVISSSNQGGVKAIYEEAKKLNENELDALINALTAYKNFIKAEKVLNKI